MVIPMRKFPVFAALAASTLLLAGCGAGSGDVGSSDDIKQAVPTSTADTLAEKSPTPSTSSKAPEENTVHDVPDSRFMPPDADNARIFRLADGVTQCFINSLGDEAFLTCRTNFTNPPTVQDYFGDDVTANAVSWTPDGVIYAEMIFPQVGSMETLAPYERFSAFGYTCTAYGPATVECSGPQGSATLDGGNVTGATVPPRKEKLAPEQPAPEQAPENPPAPGLPLPEVPDLLAPRDGQ